MAAAAILNFVEVKFDVKESRGWPVSISVPNLVKISWRTIYVFLKWRPAAILDFQIFKIWRHFCFQDVGFSLWAKFCVNMCNSDWVMAIKVNFQNGVRRHLGFCRKWSRRWPVSIFVPNLAMMYENANELWQFMCFQNGGRRPSWIFTKVKFECISVSRTPVFLSQQNFV